MEFKISKGEFLKGLERTLSVVERRNTMPSLNHALCELKDESLQISATDLEIFVSSVVPCKAKSNGRVAIPARSIYDIVKEYPDSQEIHVRLTDNNRIELKAGKSSVKLLGLPADSFPHFKSSPKGQLSTARMNCKEFLKLFQKTEYSVCTEEIRYFLTGIYLESGGDAKAPTLRAVATDATRLAMMELPCKTVGGLELKKGMIIPKKGATELRKILESTQEEEFDITCDENLLRAQVGEDQLWIRPIDGEYPDYRRVIPADLPAIAKVKRKELIQGLRTVAHMVSDRSKIVSFDFRKDNVVLSTTNPELGEAMDEVSLSYNGSEQKMGFNVRFFLDALNYLEGDDVEIRIGDKLQPALLSTKDDPAYLVVIMPMRI